MLEICTNILNGRKLVFYLYDELSIHRNKNAFSCNRIIQIFLCSFKSGAKLNQGYSVYPLILS